LTSFILNFFKLLIILVFYGTYFIFKIGFLCWKLTNNGFDGLFYELELLLLLVNEFFLLLPHIRSLCFCFTVIEICWIFSPCWEQIIHKNSDVFIKILEIMCNEYCWYIFWYLIYFILMNFAFNRIKCMYFNTFVFLFFL